MNGYNISNIILKKKTIKIEIGYLPLPYPCVCLAKLLTTASTASLSAPLLLLFNLVAPELVEAIDELTGGAMGALALL